MNLVETDWRTLSVAAQIRHLEVEGYVVLPDALGPDALEQLRRETRQLPTQTSTTTSARAMPRWNLSGRGRLWANSSPIRR